MNRSVKYSLQITVSLIILLLLLLFSVRYGANQNSDNTVFNAIFHYEASNVDQRIIREIRIPRVIGAMLIGSALAVSGALMQSVTKNPMADSGLLGINAGAAFMLTICFTFFPKISTINTTIFSVFGAAIAAVLVSFISMMKKAKMSPTILVLSGMAISAFFTAMSEGIALVAHLKQDLAFWHFGGVSAVSWAQLQRLGPWIVVALIAVMFMSSNMNLLGLSDDTIKSLGKNADPIRFLALICVVILSGISVALVGAVAFVGLIVPHIVRFIVGSDNRKVIPMTVLLGADLTVLADLIARTIDPPNETPFGIIISLVGVPFFIYLARKDSRQI
ncbi:FecCD family ABC transporter permease [Companilactobacillus ginsenosidimutans]|uniref:Ferrichrome ABC transporter permease n=1 Tax=Companilactobacillus ginsenosidimutans TaxID=1007676 RepID=A0A0H4QJR8_9LACO|nr:iron ABC transporter permease [Companilactobacillus ginsenosidimutans]AKP67286.1 ferrichrome ABC transporter permease [Companilactobacillus ginsenosidimutans]